ncbi:thiamine/thiamine pyrophosphate ABC transporter permease ThiP [Palleronia caenipelagi]|uniref:Thiamine/thiamine pyrophosphate ABC transporter permease ThiP n=1 Tax=Palleronia caenipelagi TaxID=2489174 RepID=A0A547Q5M6_9RHOB|nr:thiamine/thiamine pyrophosphate ABC transporter permease ThiP [Palleronia caenipelagi]TRD21669.1 thiamine/thiamine pyrophosphate ABC transporter permease ThiP [Palleronia caenipelagi]
MSNTYRSFGLAAAFAVAALVGGTLLSAVSVSGGLSALAPGDWAAIRFTLWQAALSALISVALAIPVARALARRQFPGQRLLITLLGAPFILPTIVAILGLLMVFGRSGWLNALGGGLHLPEFSIYGAHGVILAHVFFNLPLATRLLLQGWQSIPEERLRLAQSLGIRGWTLFRLIEAPMLRAVCPGAALAIFLICISSFAIALTLGGGPRATTIELAIYQAVRFDFDLGRAGLLAMMQLAITVTATLLALRIAIPDSMGAGMDRRITSSSRDGILPDTLAIAAASLFLLAPLAALAVRGLPHVMELPPAVWSSAMRSLMVASASTLFCVLLSLAIALAAAGGGRRGVLAETLGMSALAASPLVMGIGLFVLIRPVQRPDLAALPVTALVNGIMAVPFALRALIPAVARVERDYGRLAASLGLTGWSRLRLLILPRIRRPLGFAAGLAAALSMGDLGVIALFADGESATLPLQVYRLMSSYRMDQASAGALLLLLLSLGLFWICDRGGRKDVDA